jgi:hypothetical protein
MLLLEIPHLEDPLDKSKARFTILELLDYARAEKSTNLEKAIRQTKGSKIA